MPRPDQETQLTATLTPRNASAKDTSSPAASVSPVIKPAAPVPAPSGPLRPIRNKTAALPTLSPREQSAASTGASTASFVKSFDEIMKDKEQQEKGIKVEPSKQPSTAKPREEPQQRKADTKQARTRPPLPEMSVPRTAKGGNQSASATATGGSSKQERAKGNGIRSRPSSSGTSTTASSSSSSSTTPSFGVKTLEELLQEKNNSKPASASAAGAPSRPGGAGGVKRGREESAATTRALPQPQQKQPRADPAAKPAQLQPVEEEDDFEKELAEIGVDDINSVAAEVIDDDELNELLED